MNHSPNVKRETVPNIKEQLYSGVCSRAKPPASGGLPKCWGGGAHVRTAFQKLEFYGIVQTFPQSGTVVAQEKMQGWSV